MAFNHYAKIKRILEQSPYDWVIKRIDQPTSATNFKGEIRYFDHYYRICDSNGRSIPYCKFQQIDRFAKIMNIDVSDLVVQEP